MRKRKIAIALITALVMALTPMSVLAAPLEVTDPDAPNATGTISGNGDITPALDLDVFKVQVTTLADVGFVVDPQGLLSEADPGTFTLGPGAVYFGSSDKSNELSFKNLSSMDVDVELELSATVSGNDGGVSSNDIQLAESEDEVDDETNSTPTVYLALSVSGNDATEDTVLGAETTINETLDAIPKATVSGADVTTPGYKLEVNSSDNSGSAQEVHFAVPGTAGYYAWYELTDATVSGGDTYDSIAKSVSYTLSGRCNTVDGWSNIGSSAINTSIVWRVTEGDANAVTETRFTSGLTDDGKYSKASGEDVVVTVAMGDHTTIFDAGVKSSGIIYSVNGVYGTATLPSGIVIDDTAHTVTLKAGTLRNVPTGNRLEVYAFFDNDQNQRDILYLDVID